MLFVFSAALAASGLRGIFCSQTTHGQHFLHGSRTFFTLDNEKGPVYRELPAPQAPIVFKKLNAPTAPNFLQAPQTVDDKDVVFKMRLLLERNGGSAQPFRLVTGQSSYLPQRSFAAAIADNPASITDSEVAFFAGQGVLKVGMGNGTAERVPAAAALYKRASELLGVDLLKLVNEGPMEELTKYAQPAILVASLAGVERLRQERGQPALDRIRFAAGFSLGEFAALVFAGVLSFDDAVRLVKLRGTAMAEASRRSLQKMVTVDGVPVEGLERLCTATSARRLDRVQIANYLAKDLNVISGSAFACDDLVKEIQAASSSQNPVKIRQLKVAGAFHTSYMHPASVDLEAALNKILFTRPRIPLFMNADGHLHSDVEEIRTLVLSQLTSSVRMRETMERLLALGVRTGYEFGPPGSGMGAVMKRVARDFDPKHAAEVSILSMA